MSEQPPLSLWPWMMPRYTAPGVTMKAIAADVARRYGLEPSDLHIRTKRNDICHPRQVAMVEMLRAGKSTTQAARFFGLDHTCAINARDSVNRRRALSRLDIQAEDQQAESSAGRKAYAEAMGWPAVAGRTTGGVRA